MKSLLKRRILTGLAILTTWGVGLGILSGCNQDEAGQGINNGGTGGFPPRTGKICKDRCKASQRRPAGRPSGNG